MIPTFNSDHLLDRRRFLNLGARGMGALGLESLAQPGLLNAATGRGGGALDNPHFRPKAKRDESLDPARHAAWTTVASAILNLDEVITRE